MTTILKFPKENDILVFEDKFTVRLNEGSFGEVAKGTLARIIKVRLLDESYTDEVMSDLVLLLPIEGKEMLIKFDYVLHRQFVSIVPEGKMTKTLFSKS